MKTTREIKLTIDSVAKYVSMAWDLLGTAVPKDSQSRSAVSKGYQMIEKFQARVDQEKEFVRGYIRADGTAGNQ